MIAEALGTATRLTIPELADQTGLSVRALTAYRQGRRTPSPEALKAIAAALRSHSAAVRRFADELARTARRSSGRRA